MLKEGWREVYDSDQEEEEDDEEDVRSQALPKLEKGSRISGLHLTVTEGRTKPPARFNEGTLLAAMENPAATWKAMTKRRQRTLGETGGLGTVATRADIMDKLFGSFLLEKRGNEIYLTSKAKQL